uniref:Laminin, beta 4 n=1 Tax=Monopterus albus TaxID=43700 RepID=A0A3Q3JWY3_MONAL
MMHRIELFSLLPVARLQDLQDQCPGGFCNPQLGDLMVGRAAQLSASSTCGLHGPQKYCIIGYLEEEQKCFTCDSRLPYSRYSNSHRIENTIATFDPERKMKWWQSENGVHDVSIQLNLETVFQFSHLVLTFKSFRPAAMLVERSKDFGRSWKIFRYFAEDCLLHFPLVSAEPAASIDDVVCDSRYSGSEPSTDGEVVLKALDPIFEIQNPYAPHIQDLITLTNIRVNFTRLFTLGDTLLGRTHRDPGDQYYYALYNMVVRGSCFCNGHASRCTPVDAGRGDAFTQTGMVHGRCVCRRNTTGENCERCRDFHHDSPWRPGGGNTAGICRRCNCHGHSDSCHFDASRFEATGGVSGGVCDDCRHDRTGPQCERCRPFLYQDPERGTDDPHACIPCDCNPAGSQGGGLCDALTGRCVCKQNVEGRRCDHCKHGFFSLRQDDPAGCQVCRCHVLGSVGSCDQLTGSCECDRFAVGPLCDRCQTGFWGLGNSVFRCSPCDCDVGGARSSMCSQEDGQCHCLPDMIGRRCSDPAPGYFLPLLDYFLYEAELAAPLSAGSSSSSSTSIVTPSPSQVCNTDDSINVYFTLVLMCICVYFQVNAVVLPKCEQYFREQGYDFKISNGRVVLVRRTRRLHTSIPLDPGHALQIIPRQRIAHQPVTWSGLGLVRVLEGAGLRFTVDNLPSSMDFHVVLRYEMEVRRTFGWFICLLFIYHCMSVYRGAILDSTTCMNAGGRYFVDIVFNKGSDSDGSHILIDSMGLIPSIESVQDFCSQSDLDSFRHFRCIGLAAQLDPQESVPEVCEGLIKSASARIHNGAVLCRCNAIGSLGPTCSKLGGLCECKPNVIGRCCDTCAPMTFGFGPDGCKSCNCDPRGSLSELCDQTRGQCACRSEVMGRRCDHCLTGFWGFPCCRPCDCNGLSEVCDEESGECLNCREHTTGAYCDRCVEGYYGNPVSRQPCQPCLCPDVQNSGRFFATSCQHDPQSLSLTCVCRKGHTGPHCDRCSPGFYGDLTLPGASCQECPCNNNTDPDDHDACDSLTGECLRCLHNTMGPRCQNCKPGYYGNALAQDCKVCSCDRQGTEVTRCPLGSPCFCDPTTGQCPCRRGVVGVLCDECEDGYWNLDGASGCQPCSCDPVNSVSNICNKVTGQCPCHPEFGGRQCDECGENHFGSPDLQCISCDCNLEGTEHPSCDPETGECICRIGVTGIFCDDCAPGYSSAFPGCEECHPCTALWAENVTDVQRATQRMNTFIPRHSENLQPGLYQQRMLEMHAKLGDLANLTALSPSKVEKTEKLCVKIRKLKDAIDPNVILFNPSNLLNTEIDTIQLEFKKLLNNLKEKLVTDPDDKQEEDLQGTVTCTTCNESLVEAVPESGTFRSRKPVLDKNFSHLSAACCGLMQICGGLGLEGCSGCGGALCFLDSRKRKCGGLNCDGVVPFTQKAAETAESARDQLRMNTCIDKMENSSCTVFNNQPHSSCFPSTDEMVPSEDIEKMAQAVLDIQLPRSPDQIRSMISDITNLLSSATSFQVDPKDLEEGARTAQDLLQKARDLRTKDVDVTEISRDIYEAEKAQDKANDVLESASQDRTTTKDRTKLMNGRPEDLQNETEALKKKTEQNREMAREAREAADSALNETADAGMELDGVMKLFEGLKQRNSTPTLQGEASERLRNIMQEVETMRRRVEDKLTQILGSTHPLICSV